MLSEKWLETIQLDKEDIREILEKDKLYGSHIAPLAAAYMQNCPQTRFKPYTQDELVAAKNEALGYLEKAQQPAQTEKDPYMLHLLFWLHCIPYLEQHYLRLGIENRVLVNSLMDLTYKVRECKKEFGCCGVSTPRFYQIFRCELFGIGRLQYQTLVYEKEPYAAAGFALNPGDRVYGCHIPSSGKLGVDACMDSLDRAYQLFKADLKDDILPVCCVSWLLYPPYAEKVFADGTNIKNFYRLFDVVYATDWGQNFGISQIVFDIPYSGNPDTMPQETSLQKRFVSYIKSGGSAGSGFGILLYDGVKKIIINNEVE